MRLVAAFLFLFVVGCDSGPTDPGGELIVQDLVVGTGAEVKDFQTLVTNYEGRLEDGTVFYTTLNTEEELIFTLGVGQVIEGMDDGLPGMRVGGTRRLTVPPSLAFGKNGWCLADGSCPIPAFAVVTYDVRVESIMNEVQVTDVVVGTGPVAEVGDELVVEYIGLLLSGQTFDSSDSRGEPYVFTLGAGIVIPGWDLGLVGMRVGGSRLLVIPPELGYGSASQSAIPAFSVLQFRVNLLEITGK